MSEKTISSPHNSDSCGTGATSFIHEPKDLETCIRQRHSTRFYKPDPVPRHLLDESLKLASLAPSNSNIQNWRLTLATGDSRKRIAAAIQQAAKTSAPNTAPLPNHLRHFRSEFGHLLYGPTGYNIPRSRPEEHRAAQLRNYDFFGAPVIGIISMDKGLGLVDALSVGLFAQTLMLALVERGLGCCLQVSIVGYPEVVLREFGLDQDAELLCGCAIGWPMMEHPVNNLVVPREDIGRFVKFLD